MPVLVADVVERADVRVVELRDGARLALEAGPHLGRGGQVRGQHLDGDVAAQPGVVGAIDLAHAARADLLDHSVMREKCAAGEGHVHLALVVITVLVLHSSLRLTFSRRTSLLKQSSQSRMVYILKQPGLAQGQSVT